ncbi:MAG: HI0074 family nucleotidyltransferase substrate-binding subunit [Rhodocyclaceae bacterium]|nr:HI0074 family nucleotidyltransferase substrate-binding subunit [Rhodocyclaceae bacterium]
MDSARLEQRKADLIQAVERLGEACAQPFSSFIRDSVIQRFEFSWELAWKALRLRLQQVGVEALNPRDVFREALAMGLIRDGNGWSEAQKMRNLTSHTYDEKLADEVYAYVTGVGLVLFRQLAESAAAWRDDA